MDPIEQAKKLEPALRRQRERLYGKGKPNIDEGRHAYLVSLPDINDGKPKEIRADSPDEAIGKFKHLMGIFSTPYKYRCNLKPEAEEPAAAAEE